MDTCLCSVCSALGVLCVLCCPVCCPAHTLTHHDGEDEHVGGQSRDGPRRVVTCRRHGNRPRDQLILLPPPPPDHEIRSRGGDSPGTPSDSAVILWAQWQRGVMRNAIPWHCVSGCMFTCELCYQTLFSLGRHPSTGWRCHSTPAVPSNIYSSRLHALGTRFTRCCEGLG